MKLVIQRVNHASVTVEGKVTGEIKKGYLVLLGVGQGDDESMVERYVKKLHKLRIFFQMKKEKSIVQSRM